METTVAFIPELDAGVVVLCNLNLTGYPELMIHAVFGRLLPLSPVSLRCVSYGSEEHP